MKFAIPSPQTPGYLRRLQKAVEFQSLFKSDTSNPETLEKMIDYLAGFITEPEDPIEAREALLDATQEEYMELLKATSGGGSPTSPEQTETS